MSRCVVCGEAKPAGQIMLPEPVAVCEACGRTHAPLVAAVAQALREALQEGRRDVLDLARQYRRIGMYCACGEYVCFDLRKFVEHAERKLKALDEREERGA